MTKLTLVGSRSRRQLVYAMLVFLLVLMHSSHVIAQQTGGNGVSTAGPRDSEPTLAYILDSLRVNPDIPFVWLQLGQKLAKMPGYSQPASVWLDAYLLALPEADNAETIVKQIRQLRAVSEPKKRDKLADLLEALALDIRAVLYERAGKRELAIADYSREVRLDDTQKIAKDALRRLTANASTTTPPTPNKCMRIVGTWKWAFGGQATFKTNGTFELRAKTGTGPGTWTCVEDNKYVLRHKNEVRMTMSDDGNTMSGASSVTGFHLRFTVHRKLR